jgi:GTP-binding protein
VKVSAEFITSAVDASGFPRERLPELALAGRSNVGKSSLINALVRQKIARTSATPGKTRLANFYRIASDGLPPFYLVDLPGYGYARGLKQGRAARTRSGRGLANQRGRAGRPARMGTGGGAASSQPAGHAEAGEFEAITNAYFGRSGRLVGVFHLIDSRHPGLDADLYASRWLDTLDVPSIIVATKIDKLSRAERVRNLGELERLHARPVLGVSAQTGEGLKELWEQIARQLRPDRPTMP